MTLKLTESKLENLVDTLNAIIGVSLDIENYCTLRWFFVPLSCGRA